MKTRMRIGIAWLIWVGMLAAQEPAAQFEAGTTQVRIDVLVANGKGPVEGLKLEDFEVLDEGVPVKLNYAGAGEEKLNLLLLLDVSGSMKFYLEQVGKRAKGILDLLRPEDRAGVMVFTKDTDYFRPFTADKDRVVFALDQALRPTDLPSGTAINAALVDASEAFREARGLSGYRSVIILTDNRGLNYQVPDELVLEKLFGEDVVLNAVVTKNAEPPKATGGSNPDFSFANVFKLAAETGGEVVRTERADEAFGQLLRNARRRYLLTYNAPAGGTRGFRKVTVRLSKSAQKRVGKVVLRARTGYYTKG